MPMWVSTGLCLPGLPGGSRVLRLRKLPIWELVTSTREGTVPPGQWLVSAHHPRERQAGSPQAWARPPRPQHLLCWRAREVGPGEGQEDARALHGFSGPPESSERASEGASPPPVCLQRPSTKGA